MKSFYDVIVIGGSASGLQACLTFGRAFINVLCIDSKKPCNRYANESHNLLGNDGINPLEIVSKAKEQIKNYPTIEFKDDVVKDVNKINGDHDGFKVSIGSGDIFQSKRVIFASGVNDNIDKIPIKGIEKYWGNSIIHCPFCHGTEFRNGKTGLYYGSSIFLKMMLPTLYNWSKDINVFCSEDIYNELDSDLVSNLQRKNINVFKSSITEVKGKSIGHGNEETLSQVILQNGQSVDLDVLYIIPPSVINNKDILTKLGVELDDKGLIKVTPYQKTNVEGIYACGDNTNFLRALAVAIAQGLTTAALITHEISQQRWSK
ncbi:Thioredoxin reductase [Wickerhamomyces ciferrii]|uniref:Thioredoxin reductase n=1 Tax=Wickerhamomyces ciferrii (strain ATCC 14091 / BCRC 22168 / CBS 111 / JCM 3599 / NBRC 0793 / NRRL Y-1031 F-60-10) TaxID=1206466 RepID=K0KRA2_WICCF|nr:Thioredoxin reductase [Wickerhamomyces ciferrii]CCH44617.1 Thioredoxin reductase [Wickerhamomyces ciferrii]